MVQVSVGCLGLAVFLALSSTEYAHAESPKAGKFPVPRAELEFNRLAVIAQGAGAAGPMDVREYLALAGPFAPLDLQVTRASASEASLLKNVYLGTCGAVLKIDTARLANDFHCGPDCTGPRRAYARDRLDRLMGLVASFRTIKRVTVIAQWWEPGSFRVNEMFKLGSWVREAIPSPELGFIPSGQWHEYKTVELFFSTRGIDGAASLALVHKAEELGVGAIARLAGNAVAVFIPGGLGDNQAGVLFNESSPSAPQLGAQAVNGLEYVVVEKLAPGVYYFETS
jgi:hypothetical protein